MSNGMRKWKRRLKVSRNLFVPQQFFIALTQIYHLFWIPKCVIGGVLSQVDEDGTEKGICFASNRLSKVDENYCATRKELLAVIKYVEFFIIIYKSNETRKFFH